MGQMVYKVYFTPLANAEFSTYGDEIDVSDRIEIGGISSIKKSLDALDYDVGVFYFSDVTITGTNHNGYFNEGSDYRSIFPAGRDRCKVRIVFLETDITRNSSSLITDFSETSTITFRGLINEEGTRIDPSNDKITFKVLSRDSVLRTTKIPAGSVTNGVDASDAIIAILNTPRITSVLTLDAANINPDYDFTIDVGSEFDDKSVKTMLDLILIASNSILYINDAGEIIVRSRDEDTSKSIINLYGKSDILGRENIISITNYNPGTHRTFTSILVNDTETTESTYSNAYGFRQKQLTLDFVTTLTTEQTIGQYLFDEFKEPRIELMVTVPTKVARAIEPLDRVSINYPLRLKPPEGTFLPIIGDAIIGDAETPLPYLYGSLSIPANYGFKVIEISENPRSFETTLKLRQINDIVFNAPNNCIVGYAVIGESAICVGGSDCDKYNPATIGGAQIGCTTIA